MTSITTTAKDGRNTSSGIFLNIDHSKSPYEYSLEVFPPKAASLLKQGNAQGAKGYRPKAALFNGTTPLIAYVRDLSRPSAKYTFRYGLCVSNLAELFAQMNTYGAQGYRQFQPIFLGGFCLVYIKDTSEKSQFVYKIVPEFNKTAGYLAKLNELGAKGYRNSAVTTVALVSKGTVSEQRVPIYYRDKTQKDCTFSYTSAPLPNSPDKLLALLQEQEAKGFIVARSFHATTGKVLIFVKIRNCQYKSINIDALY